MNQESNQNQKDLVFLNESYILKLLKKSKEMSVTYENDMETDCKKNSYNELITIVQKVFQSHHTLSKSFMHDYSDKKIEISQSIPSMPPFNIDFHSLRRSFSLLFSNYFIWVQNPPIN